MRVAITGASGLVGRALTRALVARADEVLGVSRRARPSEPGVSWTAELDAEALGGCDAVVNLAGESIATRWTAAKKRHIVRSRVETTAALVRALARAQPRPRVFVSMSAVGIYGTHPEHAFDERDGLGAGFLADVARQWEEAARPAEKLTRLVIVRTGVVLDRDGGALARMLPAFAAGLGGPIAGGKHWFSWISRHDLVRFLLWCMSNDAAHGVVNATAPEPVRQGDFAKALGAALHRPAVMPAPGLALKLVFGAEMAGETLLAGQRVLPHRALELGFSFEDRTLAAALERILARGR
jgi:uncharacterized protein